MITVVRYEMINRIRLGSTNFNFNKIQCVFDAKSHNLNSSIVYFLDEQIYLSCFKHIQEDYIVKKVTHYKTEK